MALDKIEKSSSIEFLVFLVVVISTISISINQNENQSEILEIEKITGEIVLSTEESMNAFGLQEFRVGALAEIDMNVQKVVTSGCKDCTTLIEGIEINGTANITNLKDRESIGNSGSTGRVEGRLTITHLSEYLKPNFISREWISIDWDAGDSSTQWEIYLNHTPPKWTPSERYSTSFVEMPKGMESRAGPLVLVNPITNHYTISKGCLPSTFSCNENSTNINLETTFDIQKNPKTIPYPIKWDLQTVNLTSDESPVKNEKVRKLFELKNEKNLDEIRCPEQNHQIIASKSWQVSETSNSLIAPMSIWLEVFSLNSNIFSPSNAKMWKEVDYSNSSCANLEGDDGALIFGIFVTD